MPRVDLEKLRNASERQSKFLEFEREVEGGIRQEDTDRRREIEDEKRKVEKTARKKRLRKLRQQQHQ